MKLVQSLIVLMAITSFSSTLLAGVFKCADDQGNTSYQSSPCAKESGAQKIDTRTGGVTDLSIEQKKKEAALNRTKQQKAEEQKMKALLAQRKKEAQEQSALNQQLIKANPKQYSAFAIPPYQTGKLSTLVSRFKDRLPEIEKYRRLAAQKALATAECGRVEVDELSNKSKPTLLVFSVDCSSAKTFYFNETELLK